MTMRKISCEGHKRTIHFLGLTTEVENKLVTKTYFISVDYNSYIPAESSYFAPWLINIPMGQFIRLQRNCTKIRDFEEQGSMIGQGLLQQGY